MVERIQNITQPIPQSAAPASLPAKKRSYGVFNITDSMSPFSKEEVTSLQQQTDDSKKNIIGQICSFFGIYKSEQEPQKKIQPSKLDSIKLPSRPQLEPPSPESRQEMLRLNETFRQCNRIAEKTIEDISRSDGTLHKKLIQIFKEVVTLQESVVKMRMHDDKERQVAMKLFFEKARALKEEIQDAETKITIAKTAEIGLAAFALGSLAFVVVGAGVATAMGFVPAAIPAIFQALSSTGFVAVQAATNAMQGTTQLLKTNLEEKADKHKAESIENSHNRDEVLYEFKISREEYMEFMNLISQIWSSLNEIENKRRETAKYEA